MNKTFTNLNFNEYSRLSIYHATMPAFATNAREYVNHISKKVVLIDGDQLAGFMMDFNLGVSTFSVYELKRIDSDYFGE